MKILVQLYRVYMTEHKNHLLAKFVSMARPERCMLFMLALILDATVPTSVATTNCFLQTSSFNFSLFHKKMYENG